jgi:hypothetical protein
MSTSPDTTLPSGKGILAARGTESGGGGGERQALPLPQRRQDFPSPRPRRLPDSRQPPDLYQTEKKSYIFTYLCRVMWCVEHRSEGLPGSG